MTESHRTVPVRVWADIDVGILPLVLALNEIEGVRTYASCQGMFNEGGQSRPYVMATWPASVEATLRDLCEVENLGECWGYLRPRADR